MDTHTTQLNDRPFEYRLAEPSGKWLVVDDDPLIREVIAGVLEDRFGATVIECDAGDVAWEIWKRFPGIQGIVTDRNMPGLDGLELASRIRAEDSEVPIILVTGCPEGLDPDRIREQGIDRMLEKPFSCEQLASAIYTSQHLTSLLEAA